MTTATADLGRLITSEHGSLAEFRRDLHQHPELGYEERRTCEAIRRELAAIGVEFKAGYARGTGIVAHLPATLPARAPGERGAVALRADIDALPIAEESGKPYASVHPGVMHACGHDGHTAILLGVARVLSKVEHRPNPVTLIFQPAEEGGGGGKLMCEEGALAGEAGGGLGPRVGRIFGLHNWPGMPLGVVATRPGPLLAATDLFEICIKGEQTHAAFPHMGRDPIAAACQIVGALQTIVSRDTSPTEPIIVSVTQIHAGNTHNVLPGEARIVGTVRTVTDETRVLARGRLHGIAQGQASAMGCGAEVDWKEGYPVTRNDPALSDHVLALARGVVGDEMTVRMPEPYLGGEDFSYYGAHAAACFFVLGTCPEGMNKPALLHQSHFGFNDDVIPLGVEMFCRLALAELA